MEPDAKLESLACKDGACRLEIRHGSAPGVGDRLNELIRDSIPFLPDSALQPEISPGKTLLTLSLSPNHEPAPVLSPEDRDVIAARVRVH